MCDSGGYAIVYQNGMNLVVYDHFFNGIRKKKKEMSAVAGIRTRAMSLEGSDPNQLDHNCLNPMYTWEVYIVFYNSWIIRAI